MRDCFSEKTKKELLKAIRKVSLPTEDTALECNEILQDLAVNYQNEGLYGDFLDPVLELSAAISEGEWDEVLEEKWNVFFTGMGKMGWTHPEIPDERDLLRPGSGRFGS